MIFSRRFKNAPEKISDDRVDNVFTGLPARTRDRTRNYRRSAKRRACRARTLLNKKQSEMMNADTDSSFRHMTARPERERSRPAQREIGSDKSGEDVRLILRVGRAVRPLAPI